MVGSDPGATPAAQQHRGEIALLRRWGDLDPAANPTELLRDGLESLGFGRAQLVGASSLLLRGPRTGQLAITIIGSHDLSGLTPVASSGSLSKAEAVRGPGVGSRAGGILAATAGLTGLTQEVSATVDVLSLGPGDTPAAVATKDHLGEPDLILFTDAIAWDPSLPTITLGCRGRLEAEITVAAPARVHDAAYGGAALNPLNRLVEMLGQLRGHRGRVGLPGFYERAEPPSREALAEAMSDDWLDVLGASRPSGSVSGLERATQWPVVSVLDVHTDAHEASAPRSATAAIAFSLVPHQRPVEVERTLRAWVADHTPATLKSSVRVTRSARPLRLERTVPVRALARALMQVHGRSPVPVPAGGTIGAGELAFRFGAPVVFGGLIGPGQRHSTTDEVLDFAVFERAVDVMRHFGRRLGSARPAR